MKSPTHAQQPYAAFDIDGTLIRWQLYHALADQLMHNGVIASSAYDQIKAFRMSWKQRVHARAYEDYELALIQLVDHSLGGVRESLFLEACSQVMDTYKDQLYTYTRHLLTQLREEGYRLFAVSTSPHQIVTMLANHLQLDDASGSEYVVEHGQLTGEVHVLKGEAKAARLSSMIAPFNVMQEGSIAVGDSEGDIAMLESVARPIAFNPTATLFTYAKKHQWEVVVERKNVIYALEPHHGSFLLA